MIMLSDEVSYERLRRLRWMGITTGTWDRSERDGYKWEYGVEELGFKYHMNDITAALGLVQLGKLQWMNERRRRLVERYHQAFSALAWLETPPKKPYARSSWHVYHIEIQEANDGAAFMDWLLERGISSSVHYIPNHLCQMYQPYVNEPLPAAEGVWRRLVTLPLFRDLTDAQQDTIFHAIRNYTTS